MSRFIGIVSAYAYAVSQGYTGTEEEYAELMASYATVAEEAAESAESASQSATQAGASAQTATTKASEASQSATQAGTKASQASTSATQASASAASASQSASTATTKASEASASASTASTKANEASASATTASTKASEASASATSAQTAQGLAESARDDAIDAKTDAETARDLAQQYAESIDPENIYSAYPTDTASGGVASFADGADNIPLKSCVVAIEPVQSGSGDPSPDNVRPISGWTGCEVVRTGKNLFSYDYVYDGYWLTDGFHGTNIGYSYADAPSGWLYIKIPVAEGTEITISNTQAQGGVNSAFFGDSVNDVISMAQNANMNGTRTVPAGAKWLGLCISKTTTRNPKVDYPNAQVEVGSTVTGYAPYAGNTYSITFPTEAGTVYGGELDVTNGTLTVTHKYYTNAGTGEWGETTTNGNRYYIGNVSSDAKNTSTNGWSNYGIVTDSFTNDGVVVGSNGRINLCGTLHDAFNSIDALKAHMAQTPLQVVYELATPITYNLTPTEIKSLLGDNNIWADAGSTEVTYRADPKLYIDKRIGTEAPMVATDNIVSGSYFMIGNNLYKATTNIASGAAVVVGTNAVAKTMAEALNEINA